jgi:hypothetical protein
MDGILAYKYMVIERCERKPKAKTDVWIVRAQSSSAKLGEIRWFGRWRRYCFFPENAIFSQDCLMDLDDAIGKIMNDWQAKKKLEKSIKQGPDRMIVVCAACLRASCWQGVFYCDDYQHVGIVRYSMRELVALNLEDPSYWVEKEGSHG